MKVDVEQNSSIVLGVRRNTEQNRVEHGGRLLDLVVFDHHRPGDVVAGLVLEVAAAKGQGNLRRCGYRLQRISDILSLLMQAKLHTSLRHGDSNNLLTDNRILPNVRGSLPPRPKPRPTSSFEGGLPLT